jgi:hypothetical protein
LTRELRSSCALLFRTEIDLGAAEILPLRVEAAFHRILPVYRLPHFLGPPALPARDIAERSGPLTALPEGEMEASLRKLWSKDAEYVVFGVVSVVLEIEHDVAMLLRGDAMRVDWDGLRSARGSEMTATRACRVREGIEVIY